jgi:hypothetical protein
VAVLLDQAGSALLDQAGQDLLDEAGSPAELAFSVLYLAKFNVLADVTVNKTSAWDVGKGYQQSMTQMASVPWISAIPS